MPLATFKLFFEKALKQKWFDQRSVDRSTVMGGCSVVRKDRLYIKDVDDADESAGKRLTRSEKILVGRKSTLAPFHPTQKQRSRLTI